MEKKILLEAGYVQDVVKDCDYILDTYFTLYNEEDEEIDVKSFAQHMKIDNSPMNDDGSSDIVLSEEWQQVS